MEILPEEIVEGIFERILWENPQNFYQLRIVCKTWKSIIDGCAQRLLKVWCNKCTDEIPEIYLDEMVQTSFREFTSWQEYCKIELPMPHIARDVYKSWHEFPHLVHNEISFTKICPMEWVGKQNTIDNQLLGYLDDGIYTSGYAANDDYLAITWITPASVVPQINVVRIYSIHDLDHHIWEYPILCGRVNFYYTDNRKFLILEKYLDNYDYEGECVYLAEFLVNDSLIPTSLPPYDRTDDTSYLFTDNECFTFGKRRRWVRHQRFIENRFKSSSGAVGVRDSSCKSSQFIDIKMCNSMLFLSVILSQETVDSIVAVYQYQVTRDDGELSFSSQKVFHRKIIVSTSGNLRSAWLSWGRHLFIDFANISLKNCICDYYPFKLVDWVKFFFEYQSPTDVTVYAHHVLIECRGAFIVFRGSLRQLMDYVVNNRDPGSKCTVISLASSNRPIKDNYRIHIIRREGKAQFLLQLDKKELFIIDLVA